MKNSGDFRPAFCGRRVQGEPTEFHCLYDVHGELQVHRLYAPDEGDDFERKKLAQ